MRRAELVPGVVVSLPSAVGSAGLPEGGARMRVKAFEPPSSGDFGQWVRLMGFRMEDAAGTMSRTPVDVWAPLEDAVLLGSPRRPLCTTPHCAEDGEYARTRLANSHERPTVLCRSHDALAGMGGPHPGSLPAGRIEHQASALRRPGQEVLACSCGWMCWLGEEKDERVRRVRPVVAAAHAVCGWDVTPVGGPLEGVAFEGHKPISGTPCWFWLNPKTDAPLMVLWEMRDTCLSIQSVRWDGFRPSLPVQMRQWPVELTHPIVDQADRKEELRRARAAALAYIGSSTGLAPFWVDEDGMHRAMPERGI